MASFLTTFYVIPYNCISYVVLRLLLISIEVCFIFTERLIILDYKVEV